MKEITTQSFETDIKENKEMLIDVWASWCGPCRMMTSILKEVEDSIVIGKVNSDEEAELAQKLSISSIPTLILFRNGKEVKRQVGVISKEALKKWIEE